MPTQTELRHEITQQIIEALEKNLVPWRRPWMSSKNAGRPTNIVSKRCYCGVNPLILDLHSMRHGFHSKWWGSYRQWKAICGEVKRRPQHVEPGDWGAKIVFYSPIKKTVVNEQTGEQDEEKFLVLRSYSVFNIDQVEGDHLDRFRVDLEHQDRSWHEFQPAEDLIAATRAKIKHEPGDRAYYRRPIPFDCWPDRHWDGDDITLPPKDAFHSLPDYYETAFHELAHFAEIPTGWDHRERGYEMGELAAEIASSYLSQELGLPQGRLADHAAYVKVWLDAMKGDPSYVFKASTQASKATDFLLSFVRPAAQPAEEEGVVEAA
jgi:antirestriction protein ArdC